MEKKVVIVLIFDDGDEKRIFLEKPHDVSWTGTFSIPNTDLKGSPFGVLRNYMYHNYKIVLKQNEIPRFSSPFKIKFFDEEDNEKVEMVYWIIKMENLKLLKVNNFIFPKYRLPDHIEWAALVPWNQSWGRIERDQKRLLKYIDVLMKNDWKIYNRFYKK